MPVKDAAAQSKFTGTKLLIVSLVIAVIAAVGWLLFKRSDAFKLAPPAERPATKVVQPSPALQWQPFTGHGKLGAATFSRDGKFLTVIAAEKDLYLLDSRSGSLVEKISDQCCSIANANLSPDGTLLALGMNDGDGARIQVRRVQDGKYQTVVREFRQQGSLAHAVALSSDGRQLLAEIDSEVVSWNLESGNEQHRFDAGVNGVFALAGDGRTLISAGSNANEATLWNIPTGFPRFTLAGHTEGLLSVAISPEGATAASGGYDGTARLWDTGSGKSKGLLGQSDTTPVYALAFSNSGLTLAIASDVVHVWNLATRAPQQSIPAGHINSLSYSSEDRLLAGTSQEGNLFVWTIQ